MKNTQQHRFKADDMIMEGVSYKNSPDSQTREGDLPSPVNQRKVSNDSIEHNNNIGSFQMKLQEVPMVGEQEPTSSVSLESLSRHNLRISNPHLEPYVSSLDKIQSFDNSQSEDEQDGVLLRRGYYSDSDIKQRKKNSHSTKIIEVGLRDFEFIEVLGVGSFGAVWKVRKIKTNDVYAMKVIDTKLRTNKNFFESLQNEKNVLEVIEGDFVVKAYLSFSYQECLFFVQEYLKGGDFGKILLYQNDLDIKLRREYGALEEAVAKFYLAELLLAIEALHNKNIIHRDLKPENILLDDVGHIKLADFGLQFCSHNTTFRSEVGISEKIKQKAIWEETQAMKLQKNLEKNIQGYNRSESPPKREYVMQMEEASLQSYFPPLRINLSPKSSLLPQKNRIVGTPDYIAPEVIRGESITNPSLDWWSFGVLAYEFIVGIPPFNDQTPEQIFQNILEHNITWPSIGKMLSSITIQGEGPEDISPNTFDLISRLLVSDWQQRLGANGSEEIKSHPFFTGINWKEIRKIQAPILPREQEQRSFIETGSPMSKKKQREREKIFSLLKDKNEGRAIQSSDRLQQLGVDNLMRLDLLVQMNKEKAEEIIKRRKSALERNDKQIIKLRECKTQILKNMNGLD